MDVAGNTGGRAHLLDPSRLAGARHQDDTDGLPHSTDVTVNLTATDAHSGVRATYYSIDGADFVAGTSLKIVAPFNDGVHWIKYYSVDWAGNVESPRWCSVTIVPAGRIAAVRGPRLPRR